MKVFIIKSYAQIYAQKKQLRTNIRTLFEQSKSIVLNRKQL